MGASASATFSAGTKRSAAMRADRPRRSERPPAGPPCEKPPGDSWEPAAGGSCRPTSLQPLQARWLACIPIASLRSNCLRYSHGKRHQAAAERRRQTAAARQPATSHCLPKKGGSGQPRSSRAMSRRGSSWRLQQAVAAGSQPLIGASKLECTWLRTVWQAAYVVPSAAEDQPLPAKNVPTGGSRGAVGRALVPGQTRMQHHTARPCLGVSRMSASRHL